MNRAIATILGAFFLPLLIILIIGILYYLITNLNPIFVFLVVFCPLGAFFGYLLSSPE